MEDDAGLARRLERYLDAAPRSAARAEPVGPFTLFVGTGPWPYYARPELGGGHRFAPEDVRRVLRRQRELGQPEQLEWQAAVSPSLADACARAGLVVHRFALMVHDGSAVASGSEVRLLGAADDVAGALAVQERGFGGSGEVDPHVVALVAQRLARGQSVAAVAEVDAAPVAVGMHQPVGAVSEVVGVATLPGFRRRGLARAVTSALVADAYARGVRTVFLSAGDEAVARVYRGVGFVPVGVVCAAEPPGGADPPGPA